MKSLKLLAACALLALSCTGCALAQPAPPAAPTVTAAPAPVLLADVDAKLDNAIAIATAGGDQPGVKCWTAVKGWADTLPIPLAAPGLPEAIGLSGAFETARIGVAAIQAKAQALKLALATGAPPAVHESCAVLFVDAQVVGAKVLGLVGLGAAAGALPVLTPIALVPAPLP